MHHHRPFTALGIAIALACGVAIAHAAPARQEPVASGAAASPAAANGLTELEAMTFSCPRAALNAAAREAAKVRSEGTYQFAYFNIVNDSHHAMYEVHFKSNYKGEQDLKYCVAMYCQQGWDPNTSKTEVALMPTSRARAGAATHAAACSETPAPARRPAKR